ncbi:MAG TPA: hypothetical protein PLC90_03835, partial [Bacteroidales bacterium]|nr:hypothetical protein [Bacteroidales bacterium]
ADGRRRNQQNPPCPSVSAAVDQNSELKKRFVRKCGPFLFYNVKIRSRLYPLGVIKMINYLFY